MRRTLTVLVITGIAIAAVVVLLGRDHSDGSAKGEEVAFVRSASPDCEIGGESPVKVQRVGGVVSMRSPPTIVACGQSQSDGRFYVVGFDTNGGICVAVDSVSQGETYGVICRDPRIPWMDFCEAGPGCVLRSLQLQGFTIVLGVLTPEVEGIRASVKGSGEVGGVAVGQLDGALLRSLHRKEPVGFFAVSMPGCVPASDVRLEMLDDEGSEVGLARETGGPAAPCK